MVTSGGSEISETVSLIPRLFIIRYVTVSLVHQRKKNDQEEKQSFLLGFFLGAIAPYAFMSAYPLVILTRKGKFALCLLKKTKTCCRAQRVQKKRKKVQLVLSKRARFSCRNKLAIHTRTGVKFLLSHVVQHRSNIRHQYESCIYLIYRCEIFI